MARITTPHEPVETPLFPVTVFLSPAAHGTLCTLPVLYRRAGRPMASISDAIRQAIEDTIETLTAHPETPGTGA